MRIERDPPALPGDLTRGQVEAVEIGGPPCAVDDTIRLDCVFGSAFSINDAEAVPRALDALDSIPVWIVTPIRSVSLCNCATASASILVSSRGRISRIVTLVPARA